MVGITIKKNKGYSNNSLGLVTCYDNKRTLNAVISLNDQEHLDVDLNYNIYTDVNDEYGGGKYIGSSYDYSDKITVNKPNDFKFGFHEEKSISTSIKAYTLN